MRNSTLFLAKNGAIIAAAMLMVYALFDLAGHSLYQYRFAYAILVGAVMALLAMSLIYTYNQKRSK